MATLSIKVGASVDRSLGVAFRPLIDGAKAARAAVDAEGKKAGKSIGAETKKGAKDAEAAFAALAASVESQMPKAMKSGTDAVKKFSSETKTHLAVVKRDFNELAREAERAMSRIAKSQKEDSGSLTRRLGARAFEASGGMKGVRAGFSTSGKILGGAALAGAGAVAGLGMSVLGGVGVNTDLEDIFKKNASLETLASQVSNSGYMENDAKNGKRVDTRELMDQALKVGGDTGTDANAALEGLAAFTAKTGDLALGRDILKDMAVMAKATGASLEDMVSAAGDVATALPEGENKALRVKQVMTAIAGQGKLGAVEIKDLARQMAKLSAGAGQIEGDVGDNIALLGAFTQEARQRGGATSATMAATSASAMMNLYKTPARAAAFTAATGTKTTNAQGMMRNPQELLMEALRAKGMDPEGFKKIYASVAGGRAVEGFGTIYRQAGGGKAGEAAVTAEFDRLKRAAISDAEVMESFSRQMATGQTQAQTFNTELQKTALQMSDTLQPAVMELLPIFGQMAKSGAKVVEWLVGQEALNKVQRDKAEKQGNDAITATEKAIIGGEITTGQMNLTKIATGEAAQARGAAAGEVETAKDAKDSWFSRTGKIDRAGSWLGEHSGGPQLYRWMTGTQAGPSRSEQIDADIAQKELVAKQTEALYKDLIAEQQKVSRLIGEGTLKVKVMEPIPKTGGPPDLDGKGRQPSPEEKAGE